MVSSNSIGPSWDRLAYRSFYVYPVPKDIPRVEKVNAYLQLRFKARNRCLVSLGIFFLIPEEHE